MRKTGRVNSTRIHKRLHAWYTLASAENVADGRAWYPNARAFAETVAERYGIPTHTVAGVISALSVAVRWESNKRQAEALCQAYADGWKLESVSLSTYKNQAAKAYRILTEQPDNAGTLRILGKRAYKTRAFFYNILNPKDYHITIDRWIIRACGLAEFKIGGGHRRYRRLEDALRHVATDVGENAHALQAIIWLAIHDMVEIDDPTKEIPF